MSNALFLLINDLYNMPHSLAKRSEIVEATLGFAVGIPAIFFGSWLLTGGCHLIGSDIPPTNTCLTGSNFLSLVGFFLAPMGALAIVASLAVFRGRKHLPSST